MKQLLEPANPYALYNDHNYFKHDAEYNLLKHLYLIDEYFQSLEKLLYSPILVLQLIYTNPMVLVLICLHLESIQIVKTES